MTFSVASSAGKRGPHEEKRREEKRRKGGLNEGQDRENYATEVACNVAKFTQLRGQIVAQHCAPRKADKRRLGEGREGREEEVAIDFSGTALLIA